MGRLNTGGALMNVRTGAIILSCAFAVSFLLSATTHARTVEPIVDMVLSATRLNESGGNTNSDTKRESSKTNTPTATRPPANKAPDVILQPTTTVNSTSVATIVTEPLDQLPSIVISEMQPQTLYTNYQSLALTTLPNVMTIAPDVTAPLQASDHGWKLYGVAWYWLVFFVIMIYYCTLLVCRKIIPKLSEVI